MKLIKPLALLRSEIDRRLDRFQTVTEALERHVLRVMDPKPEPAAFVAVLVQAERVQRPRNAWILGQPPVEGPELPPKLVPVTFGMSGYVRNRFTFQETTQIPLRDVRITVFCDLERVEIQGIFCGSDMAHAAPGSCPVAFVESVEPGQIIRVPCTLRRLNG